ARKQPRQEKPEERDQREERVAESMSPERLAPRKAAGEGRRTVILRARLDDSGADETREERQRSVRQARDGKRQVRQPVGKSGDAGRSGIGRDAVERQPAELDREECLEEERRPEERHRIQGEQNDGGGPVERPLGPASRGDPDGDRDREREEERQAV